MHLSLLQAAQHAANLERQAYRRYRLAENSLNKGRITREERDLYYHQWLQSQQAADALRCRSLRGL